MDFVTFLSDILRVLQELLSAWPAMVVVIALIPAVVNLAKYTSERFGFPPNFDGYSKHVVFGLNVLGFGVYAILRFSAIDTAGLDAAITSLASLLVALLSLLGTVGSAFVYRQAKKHDVPLLGTSFASIRSSDGGVG